MSNALYFLKYSFKWDLKGFVFGNFLTIVSLTGMEFLSGQIQFMALLFHSVMTFVYTMSSLNFSVAMISSKTNSQMKIFSSKYLQSLPLSKMQIILASAFSNVYTLVPAVLTILWLSIRYHGHITISPIHIVTLLFAYLVVRTIPSPQRDFTIDNSNQLDFSSGDLLFLKGFVKAMMLVMVMTIVGLLSGWTLLILLPLYIVYQIWCCRQMLCDEEWSSWKIKRDLIHIIIYIAIIVSSIYLLALLR